MTLAVDPGLALRRVLLARLHEGHWRAGQKMPPERLLCAQHDVSRATVRRVLGELKTLGLITQTVGSGTYVTEDVAERLPAAEGAEIAISPAELMEARLIFEPGLVDPLIRNATAADFARIERCCHEADTAATLERFEHWDGMFHHALAEATHNQFIVSVCGLISKAREQGEWGLLKKTSATSERRAAYQREHWAVLGALRNRDAERARGALQAHLVNVRRNMFGF
jgi:DNA-binding FadR family transcriptional regulator